jgi:hypothetical protein
MPNRKATQRVDIILGELNHQANKPKNKASFGAE